LLRRRSVTDTAIRPSQFLGATKGGSFTDAGQSPRRDRCPHTTSRPSSNCRPTLLVPQTDPSPQTSPLNSIFTLGGAPRAHDVSECGFFAGRGGFPHSENPVFVYPDLARRAGRVLSGHEKGGWFESPILRNYLVERIWFRVFPSQPENFVAPRFCTFFAKSRINGWNRQQRKVAPLIHRQRNNKFAWRTILWPHTIWPADAACT
jgi:hypothetical protein